MTREELRNYVEEQRSLNNIPYHVYSSLIDGIDTLEQDPLPVKFINDNVYMLGKNNEAIQAVIETLNKYKRIQEIVCITITMILTLMLMWVLIKRIIMP